jgi:hypothetical protein
MLIANPIYDAVFKYLMADIKAAKILISTITGYDIVEISPRTQEIPIYSPILLLSVVRMDFVAVIRTSDGEDKKIIIELQKSENDSDIMRFQKYLSEAYSTVEEINGEEVILPITSIYILGFNLSFSCSLTKVIRKYYDGITNEEILVKDKFIESLTHDSFVVQIRKLPKKSQNRLEHFLMIFNQYYILKEKNNKKYLHLPTDEVFSEEEKYIINLLSKATKDKEVQDQIDSYEEFEKNLQKKLRKKEIEIEDLKKKEEEAKQREEKAKLDLRTIILKFQSKGFTLEEIALDLGKTVAEIKKIIE